jgi:hypothetical protein
MTKDYKLSFTSASLLVNDSIKVAEIYSEYNDWPTTKEIILKENILQRKKEGTVVRELQELRHRLNSLTQKELQLLLNSNPETQKLILFLAVCKYYSYIKEFTVEVLRQKLILFDNQIYDSDYVKFFAQKSNSSNKLNLISENTKEKIKRVVFTILWQAGIINSVKLKMIQPPFLTVKLIEAVVADNPEFLKVLLVSDKDIKNYTKKYGKS